MKFYFCRFRIYMSTTLFEQGIQDLNFTFIKESENSGVLLTDNFKGINAELASPDVLFALETAKSKFHADAVYFRYFEDGRSAVPQLYIFDFTTKALTGDERNRIHKEMWNGYQVPAYILLQSSSVALFDAREKPNENPDTYATEIIQLASETFKNFPAKDFDDGMFWEEQEKKNHFKFEQSATKDLIRGLKEVYKRFQEKSGLNRHVALKLLVQCLLIKYLEERDEDSASGYFAGTYFKRNFQCDNFCDTIRKGKLLNLLDQLAKDFNGKIFEWDKEGESDQRLAIQRTEVTSLADYLDGNNKDSQYVIWRLYSFSHLPVEVISSVYEELLTDSKDIVYTPEMIVSTLVDECMPLKQPKKDFKLMDVSCGSGIFLVKSYKRIVQWWRYEQWQKTGELIKPPLPVLKELLLESIHGIDIEEDAVRLSIFSLALAILDEVNLDPPTWGKLKFPDLSTNIVPLDFFKYMMVATPGTLDLIIGNPPFNLQQVDGKEPNREAFFKQLKETIGYQSAVKIPDQNPALHFLVQSMTLLKPDALLCLIQPSGPLFYQKDKAFKSIVFSSYNLLQVIDLTKLADKLWGKTTVSTAAIFLQNSKPDQADVLHLVANRNFSNTNRLFLEFDHYDFHYVNKDALMNDPYVWKANLLGGGRILQLIDNLSQQPRLGQYIKQKKKENNWVFGEGFIKGKPDSEVLPSDLDKKSGNYSEYDYLDDTDCIDTKKFTEDGIGDTFKLKGKFFIRGRSKELFQPPLLLIKNGIGKKTIPTFFSNKAISYRDRIFGIHAPESEKDELIAINKYFKDQADLIRFYIISTSAEILVNRATAIFSEDILNIPFVPKTDAPLISEADQIIIKDTLLYFLNVFEENVFRAVTAPEVKAFAQIFCKTLNSIYQTTEKAFQLFKILDAGKYFALHFEYAADAIDPITEITPSLEEYINTIIPLAEKSQRHTHVQRIMKIYGQDRLVLIKPKQLRYWLPSIALRDADETFADYIKARYQNA
jgi:hypothetical protein